MTDLPNPFGTNLSNCVYHILVEGMVRYIGMGKRARAKDHAYRAKCLNRRREAGEKVKASKRLNRLAKAIRNGEYVEAVLVVVGLSRIDAVYLEKLHIRSFNINDPSQLWNVLPGGEGVSSEQAKIFAKEVWSDPDHYHRHSTKLKDRLKNDDNRQALNRAIKIAKNRPEERKANSIRMKLISSDPAWRKVSSERMRTTNSKRNLNEEWKAIERRPGYREAKSARMKLISSDPAWRKVSSDRMRATNLKRKEVKNSLVKLISSNLASDRT